MTRSGSAVARADLSLRPVPRWLAAIVAGAWVVAIVAEVSGAAGLLHHDALAHHGAPTHHGALAHTELPLWAAVGLFVLAWQIMIAAMMVPSSLPLIRLYRATIAQQPHQTRLLAALLGGYALVWTGFAVAAFLGDIAVHHTVDAIPWLGERPWVVAAAVLGTAGVFQFSALKQRCLSRCRHPAQFLLRYYDRGARASGRLGVRHGLFCVGCCWALMLLMFAVGVAQLWWMAALTAIMTYEKTGRRGKQLGRVTGVVLIGWAALTLANPAWLPSPFA